MDKRVIRIGLLAATVLGGFAASAQRARAVDGVIEINQARALAGGVVATDAPGFPVSINEAGSYRLTSNLTVPASDPANTGAILIQTNNVTIDLNGFTIQGPSNCAGGPITCSPTGSASGIDGAGRQGIRIVNGVVRGFPSVGILLGGRSRLESVRTEANGADGMNVGSQSVIRGCVSSVNGSNGIFASTNSTISGCTAGNNGQAGIRASSGSVVSNCSAAQNSLTGIAVEAGSTVTGSAATGNSTNGISAGSGSLLIGNTAQSNAQQGMVLSDPSVGYVNNVASSNNGGNGNPQVAGGTKLGNNICGVALCP